MTWRHSKGSLKLMQRSPSSPPLKTPLNVQAVRYRVDFRFTANPLWFFVAIFVTFVVAIRGSLWKIILLFVRFNLTSTDASRVASQETFKVTSSTEANLIFQSTLLGIGKNDWFFRIFSELKQSCLLKLGLVWNLWRVEIRIQILRVQHVM